MSILFDPEATQAAFSVAACDGAYEPDFANYLAELGESRPAVVLVFPPQAAGTYLRSAAIVATSGALVRTVHDHGGLDPRFSLPTFALDLAHGSAATTNGTRLHT